MATTISGSSFQILDDALCHESAPIRTNATGQEGFLQVVSAMAARSVSARNPGTVQLMHRFAANEQHLEKSYKRLSQLNLTERALPAVSEWLLDNHYVVHAVIAEIKHDLPGGYFRELPALQQGHFNGFPRIYEVCIALLAHSDSSVNESLLRETIQAYQEVSPLSIGELWALPTMLRLGLVENLRRLSDRVINQVEDQLTADAAMDAMLSGQNIKLPEDPSPSYALALWEAMRENDLPAGTQNERLSAWTVLHGKNLAEIQHNEYCEQAADQVSIGNAITSLRLLDVMDWAEFFETHSVVEKLLRSEDVYVQQDFATRDHCRRAIEELAKGCQLTETSITQAALDQAANHHSNPVKKYVSYWLIDEGRYDLQHQLESRPQYRRWLTQCITHNPHSTYFGLLACLLMLGITLVVSVARLWEHSLGWLLVVLSLVPLAEISLSLVNKLIVWVIPPRVLPRFEWKKGIPSEYATLVVIPVLVNKIKAAQELLAKLEQHYLANHDPHLWFALLTDFNDSITEKNCEDEAILAALLQGVSELNMRHGFKQEPRFLVLHRHRQFNTSENCWMGWERKRGKLDELNELLRGATNTSFSTQSSPVSNLPKICYVLTLDADTVLPSEAAVHMISRLAHPLNRAQISADGRRVERGYSILQPRVSFLYNTGFRSLFARWFAGSSGIDPYSSAASDTYMDLFGAATFTGKGLYDVDAFMATAGHAFPENRILSHDLIESNYARCALASDVQVFDEFPARYLTYGRRDHRWIRGDWQLLPWLGASVPTPDGEMPTVLGALERWKIIDNLRRSLLSPVTVLLLLACWVLPYAPRVTLIILATLPFLLPSLLQFFTILKQFVKRRQTLSLFKQLQFDLMNTFAQAVLQLILLPYHAGICVDAIGRTVYRLLISKKHLLEWESAAAVETRVGNSLADYIQSFWKVEVFVLILAVTLNWWSPLGLAWASGFLVLWFVSPGVAYFVSRPTARPETKLSEEEEAYLHGVVKKTWHFFETFVGEEDHWLPPDNYQEDPCGSVAHRTSPTNIGVYLLCVLAARTFKLITLDQAVVRLQKSMITLERLTGHRGHFLNWYDTRTLEALHPSYVSTVDSGNLLACLLALKHGLHSFASEKDVDEEKRKQLLDLADRAQQLAERMDFRFLFNPDRELFSIGYNVETEKLDANHYDLLASEACIASFLTIALGQAPRQHWFKLGRLFTQISGHTGLISWGGTMFEYLMPRLLLPMSPGVLLDSAQHAAVARQIEYGEEENMPWGISESAYYAFDASKQYQYQSFGVPGLGLKRGLCRDKVLAPYATLLAVDVMPREAIANLKRISAEGGEGKYGFYEAIDYTTSRLPAETTHSIIKTYMAHHQGMGLLAIANRLQQGMVRNWLAKEPAVRSAALLLQERVPYDAPIIKVDSQDLESMTSSRDYTPSRRRIVTADTPVPRTHLLSNGRYSVMVTNAGSGYSRYQGLDITRWRSDPTSDAYGQFVYLRNRRDETVWSLGHQPTAATANEFEVIFSLDKADFHRVDGEVDSLMEVTVVPDSDVELRRITLTNLGRRSKHLDITSYAEVVLQTAAGDQAHPAFGKLFMETEWLPQHSALLCRRRARSPEQPSVWAIHMLADDGSPGTVSCETDRSLFVGRRRSTQHPAAMDTECQRLSGTVGAVLDPVFSIRRSLKIRAGEKAELAFVTGYAESREAAVALADRYHALSAVHHGFELAYAHIHIEMKHAHLLADDVHLFQRLAGYLLYPVAGMRSAKETLASNKLGQPGLWSYSLSGDLPICLLRLNGPGGMGHLKQLLQAHAFWRSKSLRVDLVVLCENAGGYYDESYTAAINQIRSVGLGDWLDRPGGIIVRKGGQVPEADRVLMLSVAAVVIDDRAGPLNLQGTNLPQVTPSIRYKPISTPVIHKPANVRNCIDAFNNGYGGFSADQLEYVIQPNQDSSIPPLPWSNVIANPNAGFVITDSGGGFTWAGNSQLNRLTPWSNDPVSDPPGEVIYLQDIANGQSWCPTPLPLANDAAITVSHGRGYTSFERSVNDIDHDLTVGVPPQDTVKISELKLKNRGQDTRRLAITYYVELVLGTHRGVTAPHIVTSFDSQSKRAILARNYYNPDYPEAVAFVGSSMNDMTFTGDRLEFIGRNRSLADPLALHVDDLSGRMGAGLDPCAAMRGFVTLKPGQEITVIFVLGQATNEQAAKELVAHYIKPSAEEAMQQMITKWDELEGRLQVKTPDEGFNFMVNHCLLYQTLGCRIWGRSAFYQSGGAFGFRDQLQDVMALVYCYPELTRSHLLRAASRQFEQGDVQHWWHEPRGWGVRTRFSDDFLWLPYVICHYVSVTGDLAVLQELIPFLDAEPLPHDVHERYGPAVVTENMGTLYEHGVRALEHGWKLGIHGLPLMGCGDWNDGMNRVGIEGRGESIWVAWFQISCLERFAELAQARQDHNFAQICKTRAEQLKDALEKHGYDGAWYRRAYFDDGTPLGSASNEVCKIDSIAQSWAVLSGRMDPVRANQAMDEVMQRLVDVEHRLVKLFDPPFDGGSLEPGYIKGYLPGIRENGGQYTHAACWAIQALARLGRADEAWKLFDLINPVKLTQTAEGVKRYQGEPYVIAADVYAHPQLMGRVGWTWYTGSASWYYRVALEDILGFQLRGNQLLIQPTIPSHWPGFTIRFRWGKATLYVIEVTTTEKNTNIIVDGRPFAGSAVELQDDGKEHRIVVQSEKPTLVYAA